MWKKRWNYLTMPSKTLRRWECALLVLAAALTLFCSWLGGYRECLSGKLLRLHVVANSDSDADQALKLEVRDAVLDCAAGYLENVSDVRAAEQVLGAHLAELAGAGQAAVREKGYDYAVRASLGTSHFPTKTYDGFALPAGDYRALRVTIGAGEGRNWWCVVFPTLCVSAASEWQDTAVSGGLSDEDVRLMAEEDEGYVLRFKCLELWDKLSQKCRQS